MKITDYPEIANVTDDNVFIIDGPSGTRTIPRSRMPYELMNGIPQMHNELFRGKDLGTAFTSTHRNAIATGTFDDLWVGDYWVSGGVTWRVAHFNYFKNIGDTPMTTNHIVVVPDTAITDSVFNSSAMNTTGYLNATIRDTGNGIKGTPRDLAVSLFGASYLAAARHYYSTGYTSAGLPTHAWGSGGIELMSSIHVLGTYLPDAINYVEQGQQFALFRHAPELIRLGSSSWWLSDITNDGMAGRVTDYGVVDVRIATLSYGVRPYVIVRGV